MFFKSRRHVKYLFINHSDSRLKVQYSMNIALLKGMYALRYPQFKPSLSFDLKKMTVSIPHDQVRKIIGNEMNRE